MEIQREINDSAVGSGVYENEPLDRHADIIQGGSIEMLEIEQLKKANALLTDEQRQRYLAGTNGSQQVPTPDPSTESPALSSDADAASCTTRKSREIYLARLQPTTDESGNGGNVVGTANVDEQALIELCVKSNSV